MGTGKTLTTIGVTGALSLVSRIHRVLVVAPLSIVGVWEEEFAKYAAFPYNLLILKGSSDQKAATLRTMTGAFLQVAVVNYESAWRIEKPILGWKPDLVVADEGHKLKNHTTSVSKAMHRIGMFAAYRLLLSGTPIVNKSLDIFSQYKFLNPLIFGNSFYTFRNRFFNMTGYMQHVPVLKKNMEDELMRRIHSIAFRATKAECLDLPETMDVIRYVDLEHNAKRLYDDLVKDCVARLNKGEVTATNVLTQLLRLSQLTGGFLTNDAGDKPQQVSSVKMDALADIIDASLEEGKKLVIIARFVAELNAIQKLLDKANIGYSLIMGGVKDREAQVSKFQNDPSVPVFVGQIATAGLGITLTAASTLVFYSLDFSMSNFEQAKARIHRVGQEEKCTYIFLTARDTVDEKVLRALREKADLARTLIDDYRVSGNPF